MYLWALARRMSVLCFDMCFIQEKKVRTKSFPRGEAGKNL